MPQTRPSLDAVVVVDLGSGGRIEVGGGALARGEQNPEWKSQDGGVVGMGTYT